MIEKLRRPPSCGGGGGVWVEIPRIRLTITTTGMAPARTIAEAQEIFTGHLSLPIIRTKNPCQEHCKLPNSFLMKSEASLVRGGDGLQVFCLRTAHFVGC